MILPGHSGSPGAGSPVDVVVVGAGSAGCVIAARLSEDPTVRVLLLEAGPDVRAARRPVGVDGPSFFEAVAEPGLTWPSLLVTRSAGQDPRVYTRGRGVGGSSTINAMVAIPGESDDYDEWERLGARGWGWTAVAPWFGRTALTLHRASDGEIGPVARALEAACPDATERVLLTRSAAGRRISAADAYLEPARLRPNLEVRSDVVVDRVGFRGRRATGVVLADGGFVPAARIVIAAGAIHSPAILLRSNVDRDGIGRGLKDHPAIPILLRYHAGAEPSPPVVAVGALARFSSGGAPADLQLLPMEYLGAGAPGFGMAMMALMQVHSTGEVRLADDDPLVDPVVEFRMLSDERDLVRLRTGAELASKVVEHPAFTAIAAPLLPSLSDDGLLAGLGDYVHAACTCRMGSADDAAAVVDPEGAVIGAEGLFVCDASIFPDLPRANTHLPVVMTAERLSARWKLLRT